MSFKMFKLFKLLLLLNMINLLLITPASSEDSEDDSSDDYELQEMRSPEEIQAEFNLAQTKGGTISPGSATPSTDSDSSSDDNPPQNIIRTGSLHDVLSQEIDERNTRGEEPGVTESEIATSGPAVVTEVTVTPITEVVTELVAATEATAIPTVKITSGSVVATEATIATATEAIPGESSQTEVNTDITPPSSPESPLKTVIPAPENLPEVKSKRRNIKTQTPLSNDPPQLPPIITSEQTKPDNMTFNMDLDKFITNVDNLLDSLYHFLAKMRNYSPIRNEFKELSDLFYVVLTPLMPHEDANKECLRRGARIYEISSQLRIDFLSQMTFRHLPINASVEEGQTIKIWLDVEQDPDGTLNYQSGAPILTFIHKQPVEL